MRLAFGNDGPHLRLHGLEFAGETEEGRGAYANVGTRRIGEQELSESILGAVIPAAHVISVEKVVDRLHLSRCPMREEQLDARGIARGECRERLKSECCEKQTFHRGQGLTVPRHGVDPRGKIVALAILAARIHVRCCASVRCRFPTLHVVLESDFVDDPAAANEREPLAIPAATRAFLFAKVPELITCCFLRLNASDFTVNPRHDARSSRFRQRLEFHVVEVLFLDFHKVGALCHHCEREPVSCDAAWLSGTRRDNQGEGDRYKRAHSGT